MGSSSRSGHPGSNPTGDDIRRMLEKYRTIAVVGLSDNPSRPSYEVAEYMKGRGYRIVPVNPSVSEVFGEKSYPDLKSIPFPVDIVDIFRRPEAVPAIVEEAIEIGAKVVWMQVGISHDGAAKKARDSGLEVVQSKCIMVEAKMM